jgi:hypothetical protein
VINKEITKELGPCKKIRSSLIILKLMVKVVGDLSLWLQVYI